MNAPTSVGLDSPRLPPYSPSTGLTPKLRASASTPNLRRHKSHMSLEAEIPASPTPASRKRFGGAGPLLSRRRLPALCLEPSPPTPPFSAGSSPSTTDLPNPSPGPTVRPARPPKPGVLAESDSGERDTLARLNACYPILACIAANADKRTQATLLRVNSAWFEIAGCALYSHLTLPRGGGAWDVLRGALVGSHEPGRSLEMLRHLWPCRGCMVVGALASMLASEPGWGGYRASAEMVMAVKHAHGDNPHAGTLARILYIFDTYLGLFDGAGDTYTTNFKTHLLAYTRVLEVGGHEACFCGAWAVLVGAMFPNAGVVGLERALGGSTAHNCPFHTSAGAGDVS